MNQTILLLEDDDSLNRGISLKLTKEGYTVLSAACIAEGKNMFAHSSVDLVICDIGLPDGSGLDFCQFIRKQSEVLFLFLTAQDTEIDVVSGYEAGADDYVTKPFSLMVLISKVHAMLRRAGTQDDRIIRSGDLILYLAEKRVKKGGDYLTLTPNEQKLLTCFLQNPNHILSKNQLLDCIWEEDSDFVDDNTVAVNIRRLREKIEPDPSRPAYIKNIRGLGYLWEMECIKE